MIDSCVHGFLADCPYCDLEIARERAERAEAERDALKALAADGEKYRRLCEILKERDCLIGYCTDGFFGSYKRSAAHRFDDPLAALEAAVKKAEKVKHEA